MWFSRGARWEGGWVEVRTLNKFHGHAWSELMIGILGELTIWLVLIHGIEGILIFIPPWSLEFSLL